MLKAGVEGRLRTRRFPLTLPSPRWGEDKGEWQDCNKIKCVCISSSFRGRSFSLRAPGDEQIARREAKKVLRGIADVLFIGLMSAEAAYHEQ
jgi:hypothetical protein